VAYRAALVLFLLLCTTYLALQIPAVQTALVGYASRWVTKNTGFETKVRRVNIRWFDTYSLYGLQIYDPQNHLMVGVETLEVDLDLLSLASGSSNITIDAVALEGVEVNLVKYEKGQPLNLSEFIYRLTALSQPASAPKPTNTQENTTPTTTQDSTAAPSPPPPRFAISRIDLAQAQMRIEDKTRPNATTAWDPSHFTLTQINSQINDLLVHGDTFAIQVNQLQGIDSATSLTVHNIATRFVIDRHHMGFYNLDAQVGNSHIKDSLVFGFERPASMGYFIDSVQIGARITQTRIDLQDLALFAPGLDAYQDQIYLSGQFKGPIKNFRFNQFSMAMGKGTQLRGNLSINGLPNTEAAYIALRLQEARTEPGDLRQYVPPDAMPTLRTLGTVNFKGSFNGFLTDFVANGTFNTKAGRVKSDVQLQINPNARALTRYRGQVTTQNLALGKLLQQPTLGLVDMSGTLEGQGVDLEDAVLKLNAQFERLGILGYDYQNITTDALLSFEDFNGTLNINDPNFEANIKANVDLAPNQQTLDIQGRIDTLALQALGFVKPFAFVQGNINLKSKGFAIDSTQGQAYLSNLYLAYENRAIDIDTLALRAQRGKNSRRLDVFNERIELGIEGNYPYVRLVKDVADEVELLQLRLRNDSLAISQYYQKLAAQNNPADTLPLNMALTANLKDINPFVQLFVPELDVAPNTLLYGNFRGGSTRGFDVNGNIDSVQYKEYALRQAAVDVNSYQGQTAQDLISGLELRAKEARISKALTIEDPYVNLSWLNRSILFQTGLEQKDTENKLNTYGEALFKKDTISINIESAKMQALDLDWTMTNTNRILLYKGALEIRDLDIEHQDQTIHIEGVLADTTVENPMSVQLNNFDLQNLNPLITETLGGICNAQLVVKLKNNKPRFFGDIGIFDLSLNELMVGDMVAEANWDTDNNQLATDVVISRRGKNIIDVVGTYAPYAADSLNFDVNFNDARLELVGPFLQEYISNLEGSATGNFNVAGTLQKPILTGGGSVSSGNLNFIYLNTQYRFGGSLEFEENVIGVDQLKLTDVNNNTASISGGVYHDGFKNFILGLEGQMTNFQVLNTTLKDNGDYYGTAFVTGDIEIFGAIEKLNISANATTNRDTRFYIPLEGTSQVEQKEYINFFSLTDTASINNNQKVNLNGINLDFNLDVTPDALLEIIFDAKTGDIIRGRGNGDINLNIDTQGDFNMFGDFTIEEGGYNFTLYNIINKEFTINRGSTINWVGDPYGGILDINATYAQQVNLAPIFAATDTSLVNAPELSGRYPVQVLLNLEGDLMSPNIGFDIEIEDYPETVTGSSGISVPTEANITAWQTQLASDEQELNRQVFSLIILTRFSPPQSFGLAGGSSVTGSVSELLSNQLSYWVTQVDDNLEIDVDLSSLDEDAFNTFKLRLSYTFLDGRLRVTRDGNFTDANNNTDLATIAGDWTVEYLLTQDGKFRAKMYSRTNNTTLGQNLGIGTNTTTGFSLLFTQSFDQVRKQAIEARQGTQPPAQTPATNSNTSGNGNTGSGSQEQKQQPTQHPTPAMLAPMPPNARKEEDEDPAHPPAPTNP